MSIIGKYLDDVIAELRDKLNVIKKNGECNSLSEKEWIAFQIDYIINNLGHKNLRCIERSDYFKKVVQQCIGYDAIKKYFNVQGITCFDEKGQITIFYIFTPLDGDKRNVYFMNDREELMPITQEQVNKMISRGLRILSKTKQEEYLRILSNKSTLENEENNILKDIREIALSSEVMSEFINASSSFLEYIRYTESKGCEWVRD